MQGRHPDETPLHDARGIHVDNLVNYDKLSVMNVETRGAVSAVSLTSWVDRAKARTVPRSGGVAVPARRVSDPTLEQLCAAFLEAKHASVLGGELSPKTFDGYGRACADVIVVLGAARRAASVGPADFAMLRDAIGSRLGPCGLATYIRMVRTLFKWGWRCEFLDRPIRYGDEFEQPSKAVIRKSRLERRVYTATEIRKILHHASGPIRAFVLLGINCAYGQTDCSELPATVARDAIRTGIIRFARPKTGIEREAVLWPETVTALTVSARVEGQAFLTRRGNRWVRVKVHRDARGAITKVTGIDAVRLEFDKLCQLAGVRRCGFYALRRTFRTVADETTDNHAAARVMGHLIPGMAEAYIAHISRERLEAVSDHVRRWLGRIPA